MEKHVSYEKLSKKKQRELNNQRRITWSMNPVTRRPDNPKAYNRRKALREFKDRTGAFVFISFLYDSAAL